MRGGGEGRKARRDGGTEGPAAAGRLRDEGGGICGEWKPAPPRLVVTWVRTAYHGRANFSGWDPEIMASPDDRRYTQTHEWHKLEDGQVTIGISRFAVDELTDITYVEFTRREGRVAAGEPFGEIESVKTTSELYSGMDGTVVAFNEQVLEDPSIINEDPFGKGWLLKVMPDDQAQLENMLEAPAYDEHTGAST